MADHAVAAPKMSLKQSLVAFKHCVMCLRKIAAELKYHTMVITTYKGIARRLEYQGFKTISENQTTMIAPTMEEEI